MKVLVVVGGGIAGKPLEELDGQTPLEAADTPALDRLAAEGEYGGWRSSSSGRTPVMDPPLCSFFGYENHVSGGALEAAGADIPLKEEEVAFRANFVCLKPGATSVVMFDPIGCGVSDEEGAQLVSYLEEHLEAGPGEEIRLYPIGGHRAVLTYRKEGFRVPEAALAGFSPPQEIAGETIDGHLPTSETARRFVHIVNDSQMILATHPGMREKMETTMFAANSLWLWGGGQRVSLPPISGVAGGRKVTFIARNPAVLGLGRLGRAETVKISGVRKKPGLTEISRCAEMREAARKALETSEFVLIHADDATHAAERGDAAGKVAAIEALDAEILGPLLENPGADPCRILFLSDGIVSTETRRPEPGPTPYAMADWMDGRLVPPPAPRGLANTLTGLWGKLTGQSQPAGNGASPPAFSERLCEHARPLEGTGLLKRLLAA